MVNSMRKKSVSSSKKQGRARRTAPILRTLAIFICFAVGFLAVTFGTYSVAFAQKIYPRVTVSGIMVGGLNKEKAGEKLKTALEERPILPIILLDGEGHSFTIKADEVSASYNIKESIDAAYAMGRTQDWLISLSQKLTTPLLGTDIPAKLDIEEKKLTAKVNEIIDKVTVSEKDAGITIKKGVVSLVEPEEGKSIEGKAVLQIILRAFGSDPGQPITLTITSKKPKIGQEAAEAAKQMAQLILARPIIYKYDDQSFAANADTIGEWIKTAEVDGLLRKKLDIVFDEKKIESFIGNIASKIDQPAVEARLMMADGALHIITPSAPGKGLVKEPAKTDTLRILAIRKEVPEAAVITTPATSPEAAGVNFDPANNVVNLQVEVKLPRVSSENIEALGIKERIAIAATDFKGSPNNRQENIRLGTKLFNSVVLKPGEQFSSVKALGNIDESAGFKPELVIKQDELIPEVGGGLCQVSTTFFRAAMNAGLKIDERRNHRFRVSYYEARPSNPDPDDYVTRAAKTLVGMDATIYDPSPDFKFTNDTANHILIQGKVEGTRLTFELFGTKDGRQVTIDGPHIVSTTPAPSEIFYIDDPTRPSGEIKVKERAVGGSKTTMSYTVTKDGKQLHNETFRSSYVPWQAKSYRGTGPAAAPTPSPSPTTDPLPIATPTPTLSPEVTVTPTP